MLSATWRTAIHSASVVLAVTVLALSPAADAKGSKSSSSHSSSSSSHSSSASHSSGSSKAHSSSPGAASGSHAASPKSSATSKPSISKSSPSRSQSHASSSGSSHKAQGVARDSHGKIARSEKAKDDFKKSHRCPSTGKTSGSCPGYVIDHVKPLKRGGADSSSNMQWQTTQAAKAKDKTE
jgi:hypothetical protein